MSADPTIDSAPGAAETTELSEFEQDALELAAARYKYRGAREEHIRDLMERHGKILPNTTPAVTFWQVVNRLLEDPATAATRPQLVAQLQKNRVR